MRKPAKTRCTNWDTAAPVVVAELAQIISAGGNKLDTWQKREVNGFLVLWERTSLSALAEAEMYYLAEYHELTPSELARTLKVALPSGVEQWAMPMHTLRNSEGFYPAAAHAWLVAIVPKRGVVPYAAD